MKNKIVFILGVLFAANVGYSGSQYNQNARSISYNNGAIKTDNVGNSNGKIKSRTDSYGQVRGDTGGTIKVIDYREEPIYSKNGDLLYTIQPVGDDGGLIVRMLDGREIELKDGKAVDRWKANMTILENMESVFGGTDGVCKSGLERGFIVDKNFSMKDMTIVSREKSVELKPIDYESKAVIHNHPSLNGESHAWPSLSDMFSAFSSTRQEDYIVDCYDKKTPVRIDSETGIIYKIDDIGRETVAENLEPNFQNVPAYKELKKELEKVTTMEELKVLLEKKAPAGMGYKYAYGNMPYVSADFELLKEKVMSLRAAEKNKSGTLQNASSKDGNDAGKGEILPVIDTTKLEVLLKNRISLLSRIVAAGRKITEEEYHQENSLSDSVMMELSSLVETISLANVSDDRKIKMLDDIAMRCMPFVEKISGLLCEAEAKGIATIKTGNISAKLQENVRKIRNSTGKISND